jgi:hypothetical protein
MFTFTVPQYTLPYKFQKPNNAQIRKPIYAHLKKKKTRKEHSKCLQKFHPNIWYRFNKTKLNSVALVRERTIPTERPPPVGEVSANFCG